MNFHSLKYDAQSRMLVTIPSGSYLDGPNEDCHFEVDFEPKWTTMYYMYDLHFQVWSVSDRDHDLFLLNYCLQQGKT